VTNGLVGHGEFSEVVTNHIGLDFDGVPVFARVNLTDGTDHLGDDDSVSEMGLDGRGLLAVSAVLHRLDELLDETVVTRVDSTSESSALTGSEHGNNFVGAHLEELLKLDTSVNLLFEWFSLGSLRELRSCKFFLDGGHI